ncbi:uncharacterized protein Z519_01931 [Cladophialophora bantiana CBS 173.52]|uniref:Zn(2)-C6 fungal-type domain-containing protein n=1 Tax=Cladophialophora bantiana (strain ATCC 10958 / CBS 173.52 / CDC B-1940 / NIH 8579) TaxID=1442370 RepID=A0A0D2I072_CLAB1|nr:uncharacterized protein Z519_01931 [Cladophialophora bantiana CBS 173.52]KIW96540.1 hypothetical protein Z519_01931 [Cladophialophora bantiana CBS 173.52]
MPPPSSQNASENDVTSSPDASSRGFVAVNNASSNGPSSTPPSMHVPIDHAPESGASSRHSSPLDHAPRESEMAAQAQGGTYSLPQGQERAGHKRKRSGLEEDEHYSDRHSYEYSPRGGPEPQHMANRALSVLGSADHNATTAYYQNGASQNGHTWHTEKPVQPASSLNGLQPSCSETQHGEILQQEANTSEPPPQPPWGPDYQPRLNGQLIHDQYGHPESATGAPTVAPKRKRNFSNRTKTGCMTCRQRKKKCDEAQPWCNNCVRGGFNCKGYSVNRRAAPTKPTPIRGPVPLQSRDRPGDVSESSTYQGPRMETTIKRQDSVQPRPIPVGSSEGQHPPPYELSPQRNEPQTRPLRPNQHPAWQPPQNNGSYTSEHLPPLSDLNRSEPHPSTNSQNMSRSPAQGQAYPPPPPPPPPPQPPNQAPLPHPQHHFAPQHAAGPNVAHQPPAVPPPQQLQWHQPQQPQQQPYGHAYGPPPPGHPPGPTPNPAPPTHGRNTSSSSNFMVADNKDINKSRMLRRGLYIHTDPTLIYDRQRCARALARYQAARQLDSGLGEEEIRKLLMKVLDPLQDTTGNSSSQAVSQAHLGIGVMVEVPFTCTYGYNLQIFDDVYVDRGCTFDDAAKIEIGPRSIIGAGVTILTSDQNKDLVNRKGTRAEWIAKEVIIAAGVIIGANAIIYPGVRIGENATVEPGVLVRESLKANQILRAAPALLIDPH